MAINDTDKLLYQYGEYPFIFLGENGNPIVTTDEVAVEIQTEEKYNVTRPIGFTSLTTKLAVQWMYHLIIS